MKLEDLDLYVNDNNVVAGIDKKTSKVYGLSYKTGELFEAEGGIDHYWGGCTLEEAKEIQRKIKETLKD